MSPELAGRFTRSQPMSAFAGKADISSCSQNVGRDRFDLSRLRGGPGKKE
jgi:hypothetical protein